MTTHLLPVGTRVRHIVQEWAASLPGGTASIAAVKGPYSDGAYEYQALTGQDFSRRPGPDNPQTRRTWWASYATIPAKEG